MTGRLQVGPPAGRCWHALALLFAMSLTAAACSGGDGDPEVSGGVAGSSGQEEPGAGEAAGDDEAGEPQTGGTLRAVVALNPSSLDPHAGGSGGDHVSLYPIYDTLVTFDEETLAAEPGLASSWEFVEDPPALLLTLEEGVTFHDGTPFDAEAVRYNIERVRTMETSTIKTVLTSVDSVEVVAANEVRLNLNRMDTALPLILADRAGMMVSPTAAEALGEELEANPVGAGPFRFVEWAPGDRLVVERNDDYWRDGLPYLDGITFTYLIDPQTQINALESNQADFLLGVAAADIDRVERAPGVELVQSSTLGFEHCQFNTTKPPFDDVRVREAFNLALNRESMLEALNFGVGQVAWQPVPEEHWAYREELSPTFEYDPDKAKELLAEAGYEDGLSISGLSYAGEYQVRKNEIVRAQLAEVGIDMPFEVLEVSVAVEEFYTNAAYDVFCTGWSGRPDPNQTFAELFTDDAYYMVGPTGVGEEMTRLLAEATSVEDIEERAAVYSQITELVEGNALHAPLVYGASTQAFSDTVHGYTPNLYGKPKLDEVWMDQ